MITVHSFLALNLLHLAAIMIIFSVCHPQIIPCPLQSLCHICFPLLTKSYLSLKPSVVCCCSDFLTIFFSCCSTTALIFLAYVMLIVIVQLSMSHFSGKSWDLLKESVLAIPFTPPSSTGTMCV